MDVDTLLRTLGEHEVDFILIGGVNFLLNHEPELTFDTDVWVRDDEINLARLNLALRALGAEWGPTVPEWGPIPESAAWLQTQLVFCLTTPHGALDIFREVLGLQARYAECRIASRVKQTAAGVSYRSLSDEHMLACQLALPPRDRRPRRVEILERAIASCREPLPPTGESGSSKVREEAKRWNALTPADRWKQILSMISWSEQNMPPDKRRNRPRQRDGALGDADAKN